MNELMSWQECEQKFIRKVESDPAKLSSIIQTASKRLKFVQTLDLNEANVSFIFENYYEVIKELLVALMLKHGFRAKNHQCLFTFFANKYGYEAEVNVILQMSFLRNRLDYYGELIEFNYFDMNKDKFKSIINLLLKLVK